MTTAYFSHPDCRRHDMGPGHPESAQRLDAIEEELLQSGLAAVLVRHDTPLADPAALVRAHTQAHVRETLEAMAHARDTGRSRSLDPDTTASAGTHDAALRAAGAAVAATDAVIDGRADNAFCAVRPPGHHATRSRVMGFCFFNNVAVAARHALEVRGLQRVAIADFDVHHGNGTEDIFAGDERVLMVSFFQHPLYPHSGVAPTGTNMINLPIPPHTRGAAIRAAIQDHWTGALEAFRPEMLFISAGFDAHRDDDLGQLGLVEADYEWITRYLCAVAQRHADGRIVSLLEGGYNLGALARSVAAHLRVLAHG